MPESGIARILYMEDDPGSATLFRKTLEYHGYSVEIASDGESGLTAFETGAFDVVGVDQNMPVHDGLEVIRMMASRGPLPPTIMITGAGDEKTAAEAMKLGASDYLVSDLKNRKHELYESVVMNVRGEVWSGSSAKKRTVRISPEEAMKSIRAGMDDVALMQQFSLSAVGVRKLFEKLVASGELSRAELEARMSDSQAQIAMDWERVERPPTRRVRASLHPGERPECFFEKSDRGAVMEDDDASSEKKDAYLKHAVQSSTVFKEQEEASSPENARTFEIRRRSSRKLVFKGEATSMKALVERAVAAGIDLWYADLRGTNLSAADLAGAVLRGADLSRANLVRADLSLAKLSGAILASAELFAADLCQADLAQADLSDSNLTAVSAVCAHFEGANLSEANFTNADLTAANLRNAQLFHAKLKNTLLKGTALEQAHLEFAKVQDVISDDPPQEEQYIPAPFLETARQEPGLTGVNQG